MIGDTTGTTPSKSTVVPIVIDKGKLRFLKKKDGSVVLQEAVMCLQENGKSYTYIDVPIVEES